MANPASRRHILRRGSALLLAFGVALAPATLLAPVARGAITTQLYPTQFFHHTGQAWTNPDNAAAEDGQFATVQLDDNDSTEDFAAFHLSSVPADATIIGLNVQVGLKWGNINAFSLQPNVTAEVFLNNTSSPLSVSIMPATPADTMVTLNNGINTTTVPKFQPLALGDVTDFFVRINAGFAHTTGVSALVSVDYIRVAVLYSQAPVLGAIGDQTVAAAAPAHDVPISATVPNGDTPQFTATGLPSFATLTDHGDGTATLHLVPEAGDIGDYPVSVTAHDGKPGQAGVQGASEAFTIHVTANNPPVWIPILGSVVPETAVQNKTISATDPDGDPLTYSRVSGPSFFSIDSSGEVHLDPLCGDAPLSPYTATAAVSDGVNPPVQASFQIEVYVYSPVFDPFDDPTVAEGANISRTISVTSDHCHNPTITVAPGDLPAFASLSDNGDGTASLHLAPGFGTAGDHPAHVRAAYQGSTSSVLNFTIYVTPAAVNQPPGIDPIPDKAMAEGTTLDVGITAHDADGDPITLLPGAAIPAQLHATFTDNGDGTGFIHFAPDFTASAGSPYKIKVAATDSINPPTVVEFNLTVSDANQPPTIGPIAPQTAAEGATLDVTVHASDPDGGPPLIFAGAPIPAQLHATVTDHHDGTATFHFAPDFTANAGSPYTIIVAASDTIAAPVTTTFQLTVSATNRAPTVNPIGNKTVAEGATLDINVSATDPDGDPLTIDPGFIDPSLHHTFTDHGDGTATLHVAPDLTANAGSPYTITFGANDGHLDSALVSFQLTVANVNQPPTVNPITNKTVAEGATLDINVSATDPDGDPLTIDPGFIDPSLHHTFTDHGDGTATLHVAPDFTANAGSPYTITFGANDGHLDSALVSFQLTVTNTNRPPVVAAIADRTMTEGGSIKVKVSATDPDGDPLAIHTGALPGFASFTDHGDGTATITLVPSVGDAGVYTINVSANDGDLGSALEPFAVTVTATDVTAPVVTVPADMIVTAPGPGGAVVTFSASAVDDVDGSIVPTCVPPSGSTFAVGDTTVTCSATDAHSNTGSASFKVTVTLNQAPAIDPIDGQVVAEGATLDVGINATDPDGDPLTIDAGASDAALHATFVDHGDGTATIHFAPDFTASAGSPYTITLGATDGDGAHTTRTFQLTVLDVEHAPLVAPIADRTLTEGGSIKVKVSATDPEGDPLTFFAIGLPAFASLTDHGDGTATISLVPSAGEAGVYSIVVGANDGSLDSPFETFLVTVTISDLTPPDVTVPPNMTLEATGAAGAVASFTASAVDDLDGSIPVMCVPPSGSTFALGDTAVICSATDTAGNTGSASFTVTVVDTTPPDVTVPGGGPLPDLRVPATGPSGATVTFALAAVDGVDGSVSPTCSPASGSLFPIGITTVTCTATDVAGNVATAQFTVTVMSATAPTPTIPPTNTAGRSGADGRGGPGSLWILALLGMIAAVALTQRRLWRRP